MNNNDILKRNKMKISSSLDGFQWIFIISFWESLILFMVWNGRLYCSEKWWKIHHQMHFHDIFPLMLSSKALWFYLLWEIYIFFSFPWHTYTRRRNPFFSNDEMKWNKHFPCFLMPKTVNSKIIELWKYI